MSSNEQIKFRTGVYFIPSLGIIKSPDSTQKLNLSEQNILAYLITNHHRPVTKDELLKVGWPDRIVTEASLFQVIRALRVKLQENSKGDVIETLPRVGYQIIQFEKREYQQKLAPSGKPKTQPNKSWFFLAFLLLVAAVGLGSYQWLNQYKKPEQINYLTKTEARGNNTLTIIATNKQDLNDLISKLDHAFLEHKKNFNPSKIQNIKAFAYKGEGLYSLAWCRVDNNQVCLPHSDFSYAIEYDDWDNFSHFLASEVKSTREDPIIQTELAREPTSQVFVNYVDGSGVQSKVVHHYISYDDSGNINYSNMSFITEKDTEYHHALSIRAATLSIVDNHSPFLATAELKPEMFHWAYQPSDIIVEEKSTALMTEQRMRDNFKTKHIVYSYLLYQQPYLDLVFYPNTGIYWVHNSVMTSELFKNKHYTPRSK
ncbi:winged helix-turn-helix domain-containing protein [Photobacterium sp. SDRW27]|uniref:winged helix-turn-helix domain-containing protein n=1 Tax=Photobacterium obscurum TaxID=2829490 RepID=UPI002243E997|nr:winged helix-turn-helix domain-containing protein [Photobacterium obscurum]MCW8329955.1 winged helix-turn-helix domain-containing protein [Photobacterium obscurum]